MDPRQPPPAPLGDRVRVVSPAVAAALAALGRRAIFRKKRPSWGVRLEATVAATRGSWSSMTDIGAVRWRNVGNAMSPLRTDGLEPKFVDSSNALGDSVRGAWLEPPDAEDRVLLYLHGGGYIFGSLRTHGNLIGALARATRARTFGLTYRLAPEHPFPAAVDDALAAVAWLVEQGTPADRIVLAGDSAGGNLVLNTLLALRDRGLTMPSAAVPISPWVDLSGSGDSFETNGDVDFVGAEHCALAASLFVGERDARSPEISPLYAELGGLPPLLIHAGAAETLRDQIVAFSGRCQEAGVAAELKVYEDMVHVWHLLRGITPKAQEAIDEIGGWVRQRVP